MVVKVKLSACLVAVSLINASSGSKVYMHLTQPSCVWQSTCSQQDHCPGVRLQQRHRACWLSWPCLSPSAGECPAPGAFSNPGGCALVFLQLEVTGAGARQVEMRLEEQAGTRDFLPLPSRLIDDQGGMTITCRMTAHTQQRLGCVSQLPCF